MIKSDETWSEDWSVAPNYAFYTTENPLLVPAGSVLHTHCKWNNTTDKPIKFPNEMCAFSGLVLGATDTTCIDGKSSGGPVAGGQAGAAAMPPSAAAGTGAAGSPASAPGTGACSAMDATLIASDQFKNCGATCFGEPDTCATQCLLKDTMLSPACASCNGSKITCAMMSCVADCSSDVASAGCQGCIETHCGAAYRQCAGSPKHVRQARTQRGR